MNTHPGTRTAPSANALSRIWTLLQGEWCPARTLPAGYERTAAGLIVLIAGV
jgi:hypothetical protein